MGDMHIDLQDGFTGDEVVVRVGGGEVFRKAGVRTDRRIGLAASVRVPVPAGGGPVEVEVAVPTRKLARTVEVRPDEHPHVGVSVTDGRLDVRPSAVPFGYA